MYDFLHKYSIEKNSKRINESIITRSYDKPLYEYIVECCKGLEVLPPVKLESWRLITDQTKINFKLNKKLVKDPKIKNNKNLESLIPMNDSLNDMLEFKFSVTIKGETKYFTRRMLVLKPVKGNYYILGGKRILPINQVVDNSTFVKGNILNYKTTGFPMKLTIKNYKLEANPDDKVSKKGKSKKCKLISSDDISIKTAKFQIDVFLKECNPLLYFLARYGIMDTIEMFDLGDVISLTTRVNDLSNYIYLKINNNLFIEANREILFAHDFILRFLATLHDVIANASSSNLKDLLSTEFWLCELGSVFNKKTVDKGKKVLISFSKILDATTSARLNVSKMHRKNSHTLLRWLMTNFSEHLKKDNHNLKLKRVRVNEHIAYHLNQALTRNMNSILNSDSASMERYEKLLNAISENTLFKAMKSSSKNVNPYALFRYEAYNSFSNIIDSSRWSFKGVTGLNGGKYKTSPQYRDIYPSHIGRFDLYVCSSSDPGLTGYLTSNCKIDDMGYFDSNGSEPDIYDQIILNATDRVKEKKYRKKRMDLLKVELSRGEDGFIELKRKRTAAEINADIRDNYQNYGMFRIGNDLYLKPKLQNVNSKGFMELKLKPGASLNPKDNIERDKDGFIILKYKN